PYNLQFLSSMSVIGIVLSSLYRFYSLTLLLVKLDYTPQIPFCQPLRRYTRGRPPRPSRQRPPGNIPPISAGPPGPGQPAPRGYPAASARGRGTPPASRTGRR